MINKVAEALRKVANEYRNNYVRAGEIWDSLQQENVTTCLFCGQILDTTGYTPREVLQQHAIGCMKHPMYEDIVFKQKVKEKLTEIINMTDKY